MESVMLTLSPCLWSTSPDWQYFGEDRNLVPSTQSVNLPAWAWDGAGWGRTVGRHREAGSWPGPCTAFTGGFTEEEYLGAQTGYAA